MKNPATNVTRDDFNAFTDHVLDMIKNGETPFVKIRNGSILPISWFSADGPEYCYFVFASNDTNTYLIWNNDGTSVTSKSFDMMELVEIK